MIEKIISGGQTGVDRAALDEAIELNISYGGWCPKGRIDELGIIPKKYQDLIEVPGQFKTEQENYDTRTAYNVRDSDGTLILAPTIPMFEEIKDGTRVTVREVENQKKPNLRISLSDPMEKNIYLIVN